MSCSEEGCDNRISAKGLCQNHYQKLRRGTLLDEKVPDETVEFWRDTYQNLGEHEFAKLIADLWGH